MIVTKTPLRVSFFGGGTDIPQYFMNSERGGLVLSTTINKYIYIAANRCVHPHIRVIYSQLEEVDSVDEIKHSRVREALKYFGLSSNIEICSFSDIPTAGTGLGSSSTFTVGLCRALDRIMRTKQVQMSKRDIAQAAIRIEIDRCDEPIGWQDQYAAAYGGFNVYRFTKCGEMVVPVEIKPTVLQQLNENLLCFNTGQSRDASSILAKQVKKIDDGDGMIILNRMMEITENAIDLLQSERLNDFGLLLNKAWELKQLFSSVTNQRIDEMYHKAMYAGALGGKILGAGGGGYLLLYVPPYNQLEVIASMRDYERLDFRFSHEGSYIGMNG